MHTPIRLFPLLGDFPSLIMSSHHSNEENTRLQD